MTKRMFPVVSCLLFTVITNISGFVTSQKWFINHFYPTNEWYFYVSTPTQDEMGPPFLPCWRVTWNMFFLLLSLLIKRAPVCPPHLAQTPSPPELLVHVCVCVREEGVQNLGYSAKPHSLEPSQQPWDHLCMCVRVCVCACVWPESWLPSKPCTSSIFFVSIFFFFFWFNRVYHWVFFVLFVAFYKWLSIDLGFDPDIL